MMSNFWREAFERDYREPEKKLGLEEILLEAQETYLGWMAASLTAFHGHFDEAQLDSLDRIFEGENRVRSAATDCYEYALNGRINLATNEREAEALSDDWHCLAILVLSARPGIEAFAPSVRGRSIGVPTKVERLLFHAWIRARLDLDTHPQFNEDALPFFLRQDTTGYLTLKEIALLGQMSERAVRNAAQPTATDQLMTRKENRHTVVDATEALRWLKGRRGFKATLVE